MPLQQDVTGAKTAQIVDRIRCEAKLALESKIITLLEYHHDQKGYAPWSKALAADLTSGSKPFESLSKKDLGDPNAKLFYDDYVNMAIAFNFTFNITDNVEADANIDLLKPFSGGRFSLALGGSGKVSRNNQRNFIVSDTFGQLLGAKFENCDENSVRPNFAYPISGAIGLKELIDTFVDLNTGDPDNLGGGGKLRPLDGSKTKIFADTLRFTTTVSASLDPKVTFVQAGRHFQVGDADIMGSISRVDVHEVIVGLSLPDKPVPSGARVAASVPTQAFLPFGSPATNAGGGSAQQNAIAATYGQRFNSFLDRFGSGILVP